MKPKITRKDFLNGAAFTVASALLRPLHGFAAPVSGPDPTAREYYFAKGIRQNDPRYYPPGLTGMRGSHPGSFETAHALRDGKRWDATNVSDTGEHYDLIVVGASDIYEARYRRCFEPGIPKQTEMEFTKAKRT